MNFAIDMHNFSIHDANENISRSFPEIFSQTYEHRNLSRISYPEHIEPKILSSLSEEKNQHLPELIKHEILPTEIKYITLTMCFTGITMNISKHVFRIDGAWLTSAPSKTGPWTVFTGISISLTAHNSSKITTPNTRHICSGPGILQVLITQSFGKGLVKQPWASSFTNSYFAKPEGRCLWCRRLSNIWEKKQINENICGLCVCHSDCNRNR